MKPRSFFIGLTITIIILILLVLGLWQASKNKSPLNLQDEPIEIPKSARFIPKETYLTIHLKLNPRSIPRYVEAAVAPMKREAAKQQSIKLRNGIFALIGVFLSNYF